MCDVRHPTTARHGSAAGGTEVHRPPRRRVGLVRLGTGERSFPARLAANRPRGAHECGISVVLGTPTYAVAPWPAQPSPAARSTEAPTGGATFSDTGATGLPAEGVDDFRVAPGHKGHVWLAGRSDKDDVPATRSSTAASTSAPAASAWSSAPPRDTLVIVRRRTPVMITKPVPALLPALHAKSPVQPRNPNPPGSICEFGSRTLREVLTRFTGTLGSSRSTLRPLFEITNTQGAPR
ncbi:hypothetical protein QFZ43_004102 [Streptomyces afghaniensis]|nr:hypothetical protein [Streptomyces afghaniensis]